MLAVRQITGKPPGAFNRRWIGAKRKDVLPPGKPGRAIFQTQPITNSSAYHWLLTSHFAIIVFRVPSSFIV